jgi:glycosyltransferase involved in cell wall biosynthesis
MLQPWALAHKKWKKQIAWRLYQRRDLQSARCCHVASGVEAHNLKRLGLEVPMREIPNGMDVPQGAEFLRPRTVVSGALRTALFLGRIYPGKGLPLLIEAWSQVRPAGWRLQIAGPDEAGHRAEVEHAIAAAGLREYITFAGELHGPEKTQAYLDAELFVLPTLSESFGMAIAEALAHGLPVLTTSAAPWPQLLRHECGWWTEVSAEALAAALREATSLEPARFWQMGRRGRALIQEQFGWSHVACRMLDTYAELLADTTERSNWSILAREILQ